jgi:predicted nucleic acid-binding protein
MIRAVIDVNVLLSAVLGSLGFPRKVLQAWEAGQFTAVVSEGIYTELEEKLSLPRIIRRYHLQSPHHSVGGTACDYWGSRR